MAIVKVSRLLGEEADAADFKLDVVEFKGDASYPTGGTPGAAATLGVAPERLIALVPLSHLGYVWDYDSGVDKLKVYQQPAAAAAGAMPEVPNTTNLSGIIFRALMVYR